MNKEYLYIVIYNIINIICWLVLAIIFNKWWIMLFAWITSLTLKNKQNYYRKCNNCGKRGPEAESYNEALEKAKKAGWHHYPSDNTDYCPECLHSFTKENNTYGKECNKED